MRILLVSPLPPPAGGIASWTKRLVDYNLAIKQNSIFVVNTAVIGKRINNLFGSSPIEDCLRTIKIIIALMVNIKNNNIDVAHLNTPCGQLGLIRDFLCALIIKAQGIPLVTHFRCDVSYMVRKRMPLFFLKRIVLLSNQIITLNSSSQIYILNNCGKNSTIIPNFVSEKFMDEAADIKLVNERVKRIIFVGQITKLKGCDLIIRLAEKMQNFQFVLVGSVQEDFGEVPELNNLEIINEIPTELVIYELQKADLFLFPTKTEGFPNSVAEAMACGLPIIATPVGAIPDMIEKDGGILVNVDDIEGFESAILKLASSMILREKMSKWGRNKALNYYAIDKIYNTIIETYEQVTNKNHTREK